MFYGPHPWPSSFCKSDHIENAGVNEAGEVLNVHYAKFPGRPPASKKVLLSCHEKSLFPIKQIKKYWDNIHFVSEAQKKWHNEDGCVIPNVVSDLTNTKKKVFGVAGVIGSVDRNKQTHISIKKAIDEGFKNILIYGDITDQEYYEQYVKLYVDTGVVKLKGHEDSKQKMYDSLSCVFHSSRSETFNFIIPECKMTGTKYKGVDSANPEVENFPSEDEIFELWTKELQLS